MKTPPIVSAQEWEAALQEMLVKEKELTRARDALAAMRRRMPWTPVEKRYEFEGPEGKVSLLDLFHGRRQLIVYRAFVEPGRARLARTRLRRLLADGRPHWQPCPSQRPRHHARVRLARVAGRHRAGEGADGLGASRGTPSPTTSTKTSAATSGTAPMRSSETVTGCSAPTSSTIAATRRSSTRGASST